MDWNWLHSLGYGLISGLTEILPVSAFAHQRLFQVFTGTDDAHLPFRLFCNIAIIAALLFNSRQLLFKLRQGSRRIRTARGRKRPLDVRSACDLRVIRLVSLISAASFAVYLPLVQLIDPLWAVSLTLLLNGIILYFPQYLPSGNKDSRNMSVLDSLAMGFGGALAVLPGVSRIGALISMGDARGVEKKTALDYALLISVVTLAVTVGFDIYAVSVAGAFSISMLVQYIFAAAAAFGGAHVAIAFMRYLAVKVGFSGFGYYCWGAALFLFIVYLTT